MGWFNSFPLGSERSYNFWVKLSASAAFQFSNSFVMS
jgi:hypothetical protein